MNRIVNILALLITAAFIFSCGGGSDLSPAPGAGTPDTPTTESNTPLDVALETGLTGRHTSRVIPDTLNILTGAAADELEAQLADMGAEVLSQRSGWTTIELATGTDLDEAIVELEKEFNIAAAEKVIAHGMPRDMVSESDILRSASYIPFDPMYGDSFVNVVQTDQTDSGLGLSTANMIGQSIAMNPMNFPGAWDIMRDPSVSTNEVRIAIIDAGFFDYTSGLNTRPSFDGTLVDSDHSGFVTADGTHTPGADAAVWDTVEDGDPTTADNFPYRSTGELMLGIITDQHSSDPANPEAGLQIRAFDFNNDGLNDTDIWNVGIAGCNPTAEIIMLKTGQLNDTDPDPANHFWEFTDNQLAAAIEYASAPVDETNEGAWPNGGAGADIILLGMWSDAEPSAALSTALQTARDNNALVIAPAGDVIDSYDGDSNSFTEAAVDITTTPVSPASDPNCIAVTATGANRSPVLDTVTIGENDFDNIGIGWDPSFGDPFDFSNTVVPDYANSGGDIGAIGFGIGWGWHPFFSTGAGTEENPARLSPGYTYRLTLGSFSSVFAAAYVAGAASIVHQALNQSLGTEPTDDEVWAAMTVGAGNIWQYAPITGIAGGGGLLNAGGAAVNAINGGSLYVPAMRFTNVTISQAQDGVTRGTDFELTPTVVDGTAPFTLTVNWDNGEGDVVVDEWDNSTPVTLTGGWETLGQKGVNLTVEDADGQLAVFPLWLHVINPVAASITINNAEGELVDPATLAVGTQYRFQANATNVYTGEIEGTPNVTEFMWDFDGDGTIDGNGPSPTHNFPASGDYQVVLIVAETIRPSLGFLLEITVN